MLNCKEATRLMTERMDRPLRGFQGVSLRFHLLICDGCRQFNQQMVLLRQAMKRISRPES